MKKLFTLFAFLGLALGQIVPTFGGYIGFVGNWIPFVTSSTCYLIALIFLSFQSNGIKVNKYLKLYLVVFLLIFPIQFAGHLFISGGLATVDQYADFFRVISISLAIIVGYNFAFYSNKSWFTYLFNGLIIFTAVLFFDYYLNGQFQGLQKLYVARIMGWRFPGNWNYPYNLSVALYLYFLFSIYKFDLERSNIKKIWYLVSAVFVIICMFFGQSRSSIAALLLSLFALYIFTFRLDISLSKSMLNLGKLALAIVTVILILKFYSVNILAFVPRFEKLSQSGTLLQSGNRITQLQNLGSKISKSPLLLLFGNGPKRTGFWIEGFLLRVYRYGLVGFCLYTLFIPFLQSYRIIKIRGMIKYYSILLLIIINWNIFIFFNSVSTNIFTLYRFIPLYFFIIGFIERQLEKIKHCNERNIYSRPPIYQTKQ